ncbi:MAG: adenosylcobinamide-GDP ribazoletransferase [Myxococcota bacterium]|nr:adenosylcobinamide-GDP ribazoletransferase [Myxococcota bacterium]
MGSLLKSFVAAVGFLTIVPVPGLQHTDEQALSRSRWFFPIVGLGIGGAIAAVDLGVTMAMGAFVFSSAVAVLLMIGVSKALHMDGLADTWDGFFSSRPREQILEIMRDSRVGVMGAIAVSGLMLLKVCALISLPLAVRWQTILLMPLCGRCALLFQLGVLPYARSDGGLATAFLKHRTPVLLVYALGFSVAIGWWVLSYAGVLATAGVFAATLLFSRYCYRKIGGLTGDTLGAACEIGELVPAVALIFYDYQWGPL